jgi:O-antigen/teichoic acid export membrane protein
VSNRPIETSKKLRNRIISGSAVLLSGSSLTTLINLGYNILVARFLGASGYGHVAVVYTMLTIASAVTLSFQIVSAKVVAQQASSAESRAAAYRFLHRSAWSCGLFVACLLVVFRQSVADYLRLPSPLLVVLLAVGAAFYVPLGSRRGYILGACGFKKLASSLILEAGTRLIGSLVAVFLGFGVTGVIAANAAAEAIAWAVIPPARTASGKNPLGGFLALRELLQALVFFSGQVLINNSDIVLVKHFFAPATAGLYAAIALVGRVIFSFSAAIMNGMFPVVAGARHEERKNLSLIATSLLLVLGIGSAMAIGLRIAPPSLWTTFFGPGFHLPGPYGLPYLLSLKAVVTMVFSLSIILIAYEMSYRIANTSWVQLAFGGAVIAGICRFHSSLREVLLVQLLLMLLLLLVVGVPFVVSTLRDARASAQSASPAIRLIRHLSEDEVISEFLRSDFDHHAYSDYHASLRPLVDQPSLDSSSDCAQRRALLYVRHLALWKELPANTEWYEVELRLTGLDQIQVFPRAQWRKIARGNFRLPNIVEKLARQPLRRDSFLSTVEGFRQRLARGENPPGAVLLIGRNEFAPLTVIDGNHRLAAAALEGRLPQLRVFCGLSPTMNRCCWYRGNLLSLSRYGTNRMRHLTYHPEAELDRLFERSGHIL